MKVKTLMISASLALSFLATAQIAQAQQDGEAQAVIFGADNAVTLKFSNKEVDKQGCGLFVSRNHSDKRLYPNLSTALRNQPQSLASQRRW